MFTKYNALSLIDFFECEPVAIGDDDASDFLYSYEDNGFKIIVVISTYEMRVKTTISYIDHLVYSSEHSLVSEIVETDPNTLRLLTKNYDVVILKQPQISVIIEK